MRWREERPEPVAKPAALLKRSALAFGGFAALWLAKTCSRLFTLHATKSPPSENQSWYSTALQFGGWSMNRDERTWPPPAAPTGEPRYRTHGTRACKAGVSLREINAQQGTWPRDVRWAAAACGCDTIAGITIAVHSTASHAGREDVGRVAADVEL